MKSITIIFLFVFLFMQVLVAQNENQQKIDSLKHQLAIAAHDSLKVPLLLKLGKLSDVGEKMDYYKTAIAISERINNKYLLIEALNDAATAYNFLGDISTALEYFNRALIVAESTKDSLTIADLLNNLAFMYNGQGDSDAAMDYNHRSLKIREQLNDSIGIAYSLNNIGMAHYKKREFDNALACFTKSLAIRKALGNKPGMAISYQNLGGVYRNKGDMEKAFEYFAKSLKLRRELNDHLSVSQSLNTLGAIYLKQGKLKLAHAYSDSSLAIALKYKSPTFIKDAEATLAKIDSAMGNYKGAFEHYSNYIFYRDSISNDETKKATVKSQLKYEFDKKELAAKAEQEKKDAIAGEELRRQKLLRNGFVGGFSVMLVFSVVFFSQRNKIRKGKKRSDELLLNILPSEVAEELKEKGYADAKQFDEVTVLFTDFKGFTSIAEKLSPHDLVKEINDCFSAFDKICERYGIEKIKTIGDAYMAAGGLPIENRTHATDVVSAALEMRDYMKSKTFEIRIGIHTGTVVAGIVGIKKFQYDIWGDTVNTASRMESSGEAGNVNISEATYEKVKEKFNCISRGKVKAKNKGEIEMYFVEGLLNKL